MISKKMLAALNEQISMEASASQKYLAMACWCEDNALENSAAFMFRQAEEEREHMHKIIRYVLERGERVEIPSVDKPKGDYKNIKEAIETATTNEASVTKSINNLVDLAMADKDHATYNFLQWFVDEQCEEEALFIRILDKIKLIGDGAISTYYVDRAIGKINMEVEAADQGAAE